VRLLRSDPIQDAPETGPEIRSIPVRPVGAPDAPSSGDDPTANRSASQSRLARALGDHLDLAVSTIAVAGVVAAGLALTAAAATLGLVVVGAGVGAGFASAALLVRARLSFRRPLDRLAEVTRTLATSDTVAFADTLRAMAQGDLTRHLELRAEAIEVSGAPEVARVVEQLNAVVGRLAESAREFNTVTDEPCQRLCYVGPDGFLQGHRCGQAMGEALGGRGQVLVMTALFDHSGLELRRHGFESHLRDNFPGVELIDAIENDYDPSKTYALTRTFLKRYPQLGGIYSTEAVGVAGAARAVAESGRSGRVKVMCHDLVDETMPFVVDGSITATVGQDPYAQGHDSAIHLFNHLTTGWLPANPILLTEMDLVTPENWARFWQRGKGVIESQSMAERRARPLKKADRRIKIAVLGIEDNPFWNAVRAGTLAARAELKDFNAEVDWIVPEPDKAFHTAVRGPAIEDLAARGYAAIATPVQDAGLVPFINRVAARGVAVATFNSETSSLRSLMSDLSVRAERLLTVSSDMAASAASSREANREVAGTIGQMAEAVGDEAAKVNTVTSRIQGLAGSMAEIASSAHEQAKATERLSSATAEIAAAIGSASASASAVAEATTHSAITAQQGTEAIRNTLAQMESIQAAVDSSAATIAETNELSARIGNIVVTIDEIADQTNLLALNAAIEAARAGEQGKGFAVVADEVRKLAERSQSATREIATIVATVQQSAARAAAAMDAATRKVQQGAGLARDSGKALDDLLASAKETQLQTGSLVAAHEAVGRVMGALETSIDSVSAVVARNIETAQTASASISEALAIVENVAAISEENAASAERMAASTQEVSAQTEEVNAAALSLTQFARELEASTARFTIG